MWEISSKPRFDIRVVSVYMSSITSFSGSEEWVLEVVVSTFIDKVTFTSPGCVVSWRCSRVVNEVFIVVSKLCLA